MKEQDKAVLAGFLNDLAATEENTSGDYNTALADVAWLAGLNWSDASGGWVIPGDDIEIKGN